MSQDQDERAVGRPAGGAGKAGVIRPSAAGDGDARAAHRPIDAVARARIGRGLRLHYAEVLALPIPDHFRTLIDDLAACSDTEATR